MKFCIRLWSWDGTRSESIIFEDDDVKGLSEDEIKEIVKTSSLLKDKESTHDIFSIRKWIYLRKF